MAIRHQHTSVTAMARKCIDWERLLDELQVIASISANMRRIFESVLVATDVEGTSGTCLYASILLQQSLDRFGGCETVVRGGDGLSDGGARDTVGAWHGHYWVEGVTSSGAPFLADITADQFGWPSVVVLPLADARSRYVPGNDELCGQAVEDETRRMVQVLEK